MLNKKFKILLISLLFSPNIILSAAADIQSLPDWQDDIATKMLEQLDLESKESKLTKEQLKLDARIDMLLAANSGNIFEALYKAVQNNESEKLLSRMAERYNIDIDKLISNKRLKIARKALQSQPNLGIIINPTTLHDCLLFQAAQNASDKSLSK